MRKWLIILALALSGTVLIAGLAKFDSDLHGNRIKLSEHGILGDSTDVTDLFRAVIDSFPGYTFEADSGKYLLSDSLTIEGHRLLSGAAGSELIFMLSDDGRGLCLGDYGHVSNFTVRACTTETFTGSGEYGTAIFAGNYGTGAGATGFTVQNVKVYTDRAGGNSIFVTGNSNNFIFDNIEILQSDSAGMGALFHWGAADTSLWGISGDSITYHPHNFVLRNWHIDSLPRSGSRGLDFSGCYNFSVQNVTIDYAFKAVCHHAGDFGYYFADPAAYDTAIFSGQGASFSNVISFADSVGFQVIGEAPEAPGSPNYDMATSFTDCYSYGRNGDVGNALDLEKCGHVTFYHGGLYNHTNGLSGTGYHDVQLLYSDIYGHHNWGAYLSSDPKPDHIRITGNRIIGYNGIYLLNVRNVTISGNTFGDPTIDTLYYGIYMASGWDSCYAVIYDNVLAGGENHVNTALLRVDSGSGTYSMPVAFFANRSDIDSLPLVSAGSTFPIDSIAILPDSGRSFISAYGGSDGQVPTKQSDGSIIWDDPPGAGGGDNVSVDSGDATYDVTDPVFTTNPDVDWDINGAVVTLDVLAADSAGKAGLDGSGNNIVNTYYKLAGTQVITGDVITNGTILLDYNNTGNGYIYFYQTTPYGVYIHWNQGTAKLDINQSLNLTNGNIELTGTVDTVHVAELAGHYYSNTFGYIDNAAVTDSSITLLNGTAWRLFYTNATTTAIQELALGASGTYLKSTGASGVPTWDTPAGTGEWTEVDGAGAADSLFWIAPNADSALGISSDGSGHTSIWAANQSDNSTSTLKIVADTISGGGSATESVKLFIGNNGLYSKAGSDSAGYIDIFEDSDDGTDKIHIRAQALSASYTLTLPTTAGGSGEYLKSDGSGSLSWDTPASNAAITDSSITLLNATAWRLFYSNATTTAIQELALGASGTYLKSTGASGVPTWDTPAGGSGIFDDSTTYHAMPDATQDDSVVVKAGAGDARFVFAEDSTFRLKDVQVAKLENDGSLSIGPVGLTTTDSLLGGVLKYLMANGDTLVFDTGRTWSDGYYLKVKVVAGKADTLYLASVSGTGTIDSAMIDLGGGVFKSSSDKAWKLRADYGLTYKGASDSAGIDTSSIIVDTADAVADAEIKVVTGNAVYDFCQTTQDYLTTSEAGSTYEPLLVNEAGLYSALSDVDDFLQLSDTADAVADAETKVVTGNAVYDFCQTTQDYLTTSEAGSTYEPLLVNEAGLYSALSDVDDFLQLSDTAAAVASASYAVISSNAVYVFCETTQDYLKSSELASSETDPTLTNDSILELGRGATDTSCFIWFNVDAGTDGQIRYSATGDLFEVNRPLYLGDGAQGVTADSALITRGTLDSVVTAARDTLHFRFNMANPDGQYTLDHEWCITDSTEKAITIIAYRVTCDADPTTEVQFSFHHTDNFITRTTPTQIDASTTVNGKLFVNSGFDDATVDAARCIYFQFDADPDDNITQLWVDILYVYD